MSVWKAAWSIAAKDWMRFTRQPFLMAVSVLVPLVFVLFYSLIVPSSQTSPVVVAVEDPGAEASSFLETLRTVRSEEAPWFEIVTEDPAEARTLFDSGDALGMIVIPAGFGSALAEGQAVVELYVHNINSDYSKNLGLRLDHAVRSFDALDEEAAIRVHETTVFPRTLAMGDYISTSILLFAAVYSGLMTTGLAVATEWSERTVKHLILAPQPRSALVMGKALAGLGQSIAPVLGVTGALMVTLGFSLSGSGWAMAGIVAVMMILGAGLGAIIGVLARQTLTVVSLGIPTALGIFFISGYEDSLRGLGWDGPVALLWEVSRALPTTPAFDAARALMLTGDSSLLAAHLLPTILAAVVVLAVAVWVLRRAYRALPGGQ